MRWKTRIGAALLVAGATASAHAAQETGASYDAPAQTADAAPASAPYPGGQAPEGPHGSSQTQPGEERYDQVGYAVSTTDAAGFDAGAANAASRDIPVEDFAEVTSLDSGRTILVKIAGKGPAAGTGLIDLSPMAAKSLGLTPGEKLGVRVRTVPPTPEDAAALRAGTVPQRMDAPDLLLKALRKQLPATTTAATAPKQVAVPPSKPAETPKPAPATKPASLVAKKMEPAKTAPAEATTGPYYVQVAALSNEAKAKALANKLHGYVKAGGGLYRIRVGGFDSHAAAEQKRGEIARAGYGDARVYRND